ncbi:MAG: SDR family NAD(P)-dependent oxidoreductase [Deltaproteobacteria bacterium]
MKKVALITGVSSGIGKATSTLFADSGWSVIGVDREPAGDPLDLKHFIQMDISEKQTPQKVIEKVERHEGRLDALVNNAAMQICKPLTETTLDEWDLTMACNVRAAFLLAKTAYPLLKKQRGAIVNVSSVHAVATSINIAAYAASKGALMALTRAIALEFAQDNIRANAILPGAVDTAMLHSGLVRGHIQGSALKDLVSALAGKHPMGRIGRPNEIAEGILFLADGERSGFITGQAIIVDGGATARLSTE